LPAHRPWSIPLPGIWVQSFNGRAIGAGGQAADLHLDKRARQQRGNVDGPTIDFILGLVVGVRLNDYAKTFYRTSAMKNFFIMCWLQD
jgi:hypothetical protein